MHSTPSLPLQIGYCTNVHAGRDLPSVLANIQNHSLPIRRLVRPDSALGIGLWFSEDSVAQALSNENRTKLKDTLEKSLLIPFTLNGFPQGDFHSQVVKHRVYLPTWWDRQRLDYTLNLIELLDYILPNGEIGSISTLPIAWGTPAPSQDQWIQAAGNLMQVANALHRLHETTGRTIVLAIEPEPGCLLTDSRSLRAFFNRYLAPPFLDSKQAEIARRYLSVCHDVCHAAVMYEDQAVELACMKNDGIAIGKVQVSSAIEIDWHSMSPDSRLKAFEQLRSFAEDRYLHQTLQLPTGATQPTFVEDLPRALDSVIAPAELNGSWRVHFHVPIYLEQMGHLQSTRSEIVRMLRILLQNNTLSPRFSGHFELETYAWGVAPENVRDRNLNQGIADEILWFENLLKETLSSRETG